MNWSTLVTIAIAFVTEFNCLPNPQISGLTSSLRLETAARIISPKPARALVSAPAAVLRKAPATPSSLKSTTVFYKKATQSRLTRPALSIEAGMPSHFAEQPKLRYQIGDYKIKKEWQNNADAEKYFLATSKSLYEADHALAKAEARLEKLESELSGMTIAKAAVGDIRSKQLQVNQAKYELQDVQKQFEYAEKDYKNVGTFIETEMVEVHRSSLEKLFTGKPQHGEKPPALTTISDDEEDLHDHPDMPIG